MLENRRCRYVADLFISSCSPWMKYFSTYTTIYKFWKSLQKIKCIGTGSVFNISAKNVDIKMLLISMQFTALSLHVSYISQIFCYTRPWAVLGWVKILALCHENQIKVRPKYPSNTMAFLSYSCWSPIPPPPSPGWLFVVSICNLICLGSFLTVLIFLIIFVF